MLFSVITVTYNSAPFLDQCIQSVLNQDFEDFEYLIADDNSSDGSWDIISRYSDPRIRAFKNIVNLGEYRNRANAIAKAAGEYLIFIDGDDVMYKHALSTFEEYVTQFPSAAMFFSREWDSRILCPFLMDPRTTYQFEYLDAGVVGVNFTKVLFKSGIIRNYDFKEGVRSGDTYIQLRIAQDHQAVVVPSGLTWWRRRSDNATQQLFSDYRHLAETVNYRSELLLHGCPLTNEENELARNNLYGTFLRYLLRLLFHGKIKDLRFLLRNAHIPARYFPAIFKPSQTHFFGRITGDRPLQTNTFKS